MTLIKKSDVKNHLSARRYKGSPLHLVMTSQPDATGFSGTEKSTVEAAPSGFMQDFTADHTTASKIVAQSDAAVDSFKAQTPSTFEKA